MNIDLTQLNDLVTQFVTALKSGNIGALAAVGIAVYYFFARNKAAQTQSNDLKSAAAMVLLGPDTHTALTKAVADKFGPPKA